MSDRKEKEKGSFSKSGQNRDFAKLLRIFGGQVLSKIIFLFCFQTVLATYLKCLYFEFSYHFALLHCGVRSKSKSRAQWLRRRQE